MKTKEDYIDEIYKYIKELGKELQEDQTIQVKDKIPQVDLFINTIKFLQDYDENVKVLDKYWREKNRKLKFERSQKEYEERNK